jgi:hypothetical protein
VSAWRGTNLPKNNLPPRPDSGTAPRQLDEIVIHVAPDAEKKGVFEYRIRNWKTSDLKDLHAHLGRLRQVGPMAVVLDPRPETPFSAVAGAIASATAHGLRVEFRPPAAGAPTFGNPVVKNELMRRAIERCGPDGLSTLGVRVRADARAPWAAVTGVLMGCMEARVWRVSFAAMVEGSEVCLGRQEPQPGRTPVVVEEPKYEEKNLRDVFKGPAGVEVERPVVIHEKVEPDDHFETEDDAQKRTPEEAISDLPLGGTGVVGQMGVGGGGMAGCFGYRDGGGRKRAVARFGGSAASESAVAAGLRWLARHQEADGSWVPSKWEGAKEASAERGTALATLAFLGAGHTTKTGRFRDNVSRAVKWLLSKQAAHGGFGEDATTHAVCTLALVEVYGMTKDPKVGKAAQKSVDRARVLQKPYSGWPKEAPDVETTAWFVQALKSAKVAGLKVDAAPFQGATAFLVKAADEKGRFRNLPGKGEVSGRASACGALCRMLMGTPPSAASVGDPLGHVMEKLPAWGDGGRSVDFGYWHWGTLAAFQFAGDSWRKWNAATRDMLCDNQRKGGPMDGSVTDVDGSWDSHGDKELGRLETTALGALTLEVYYRYLPVHLEKRKLEKF